MVKTYVTVQGDMWDAISYRLYGSEKYMGLLMQANMEYLDVFVFGAGTVLAVPAWEDEKTADMPPWR